jgi:hypothetical protein
VLLCTPEGIIEDTKKAKVKVTDHLSSTQENKDFFFLQDCRQGT